MAPTGSLLHSHANSLEPSVEGMPIEGEPVLQKQYKWAQLKFVNKKFLPPEHQNNHDVCLLRGTITMFLKILFIFRERGREGEKHPSVTSHKPPTGDLADNPGMCPDRELNRRPFGFRDNAQPTEPHQSGLDNHYFFTCQRGRSPCLPRIFRN